MTPADLTIRRAQPGEEELLSALAARTFREAYGSANSPEDLARHLQQHCSVAYFARRLAEPTSSVLVAETGGAVAGYAELAKGTTPDGVPEPARQLVRFYLEQAWIGRGISGPLMAASVAEARDRGAMHLWLTAWEQALRPIAFYRKCGFRAIGTIGFAVGADLQRDLLLVMDLRGSA